MLVLWFAGVLRAGAVMDSIFSLVTAAMAISLIFSLMLFLCPIRTPSSAHVTYDNTGMIRTSSYLRRLRSEVMCVFVLYSKAPAGVCSGSEYGSSSGHHRCQALRDGQGWVYRLGESEEIMILRLSNEQSLMSVLVLQAMMDVNYLLTAVEMKNSSLSLLLVIIFQLIYILDFLIDEVSQTNWFLSCYYGSCELDWILFMKLCADDISRV